MTAIAYNPDADINNWLRIARTYPDSFQFTKEYPFDRNIPLRDDRVAEVISTVPKTMLIHFRSMAKALERSWGAMEETTARDICRFLKVEYIPISVRVNLTTAYLMPYDTQDQWFMVPTHKPLVRQLDIITHELFHLYHVRRTPDATPQEREALVEEFLRGRLMV